MVADVPPPEVALHARPMVAPALDDSPLYAIGDIHGRLDLLDRLLGLIEADAGQPYALVLLGDYVDRGPDSRGVLERILQLPGSPRVAWFCALRGNHEDMLHAFIADPAFGPRWSDYGARPTLRSYGVEPPLARSDEAGWIQASQAFREAFPPKHRQLLEDLPTSVEWKRFIFVHAGVRPGVALMDQTAHDLTTIRQPFLSADEPLPGSIVVFGHTPQGEVRFSNGRIGVDTGAYATGVLSALKVQGSILSVLDTRGATSPLGAAQL